MKLLCKTIIVIMVLFHSGKEANAFMYWSKTEPHQNDPRFKHRTEFFSSREEASQACESFIGGIGYPERTCHTSGGTGNDIAGSSAWEDGWLCELPCTGPPENFKEWLYTGLYCANLNETYSLVANSCVRWYDRYHDKPQVCQKGFGNPIYPLTGSKRVQVPLGHWIGGELELSYDTRRKVPGADAFMVFGHTAAPSFGSLWETNLHRKLIVQTGPQSVVQASRGKGVWVTFVKDGAGNYTADADIADRLVSNGAAWRYFDSAARSVEDYDSTGKLLSITWADGRKLSFGYSAGVVAGVSPRAGLLITATDRFGHIEKFNYEQPEGISESRIYQIVGSDGSIVQAGYDIANNLNQLTWSDLKTKRFVYEQSELPWALTGVIDEEAKRHLTYAYDAQGRAVDTQAAGGVDHYHASWGVPPSWQVTETYDADKKIIWRDHQWAIPQNISVSLPNGQSTALSAENVVGMSRGRSQSQPAGSGCDASTSDQSYDSRGNVTTRLDFNQVRSCHAYHASRNVETFRVEGFASSDNCPADLAAYQVPADRLQRKISTEWHPSWKLEARRAEPKRITTTVYNGFVDPVDPNHPTLTCASGAPALPDGSLIAVVCRRYEQSTDDDTGNLGFTAPVKETRVWNYAYNQYGQVLSESDPRTGKLTTYEYWSPTAFTGERGHWLGDLKTVTNALNQTTNYLEYNKRGQVLSTLLPNGSTEQREYHARGWLTKVTLVPAGGGAGQVTQYDYFDTGLLKKVTQPDGSYASYTWDPAHRLVGVSDTLNNSVTYELDNAGNRKSEQFRDPQGTLAKTISRTFDALGRMNSSTGLQ